MLGLRPRFFYGWVIVSTISVVGFMSMGMGTLNFGLFVNPMGATLGINRALFGWAQTARMASGALMGPVMGRLLDRYGPRILLAAAALISGLCLALLGKITVWWQLVLLFAFMGASGMSGPGSLLTTVPVAKWFVRQRGRAMALTALGLPIGAIFLLPFTQFLIASLGWRNAWIVLGIMGSCVIVPISLLFLRRQPEDMGLLPDGDTESENSTEASTSASPSFTEALWTLEEALRTTTLWRLVLVFSLTSLNMGIMGVHRIPHFIDRGFDPQLVSFAISVDAGTAALTTFASAFVMDRVAPRHIGAVAFSGLAGAVALMIFSYTPLFVFSANALWGLSVGLMLVIQSFIWAHYFGRAFLGTIRGIVFPITLFVGGIGAPLAGYVNDATGSYVSIWWFVVIGFFFAASILLLTPPPSHPTPAMQPSQGQTVT